MRTWLLALLGTLLYFIGFANVHGQRLPSLAYTTEQGLPNDNIYSITQDPYGFLWIGSELGLSRFDGHSFQHYGLPEGLPGLTITGLLVDADSNLWVGCFQKGIAVLALHPQGGVLLDTLVGQLGYYLERAHGRLVTSFEDKGILTLDLDSGKIVTHPLRPELNGRGTAFATRDPTLWLSNNYRRGKTSRSFQYQVLKQQPNGQWQDSFLPMALHTVLPPNAQGLQWAGGDGGLYQIDPSTGLPMETWPIGPGVTVRKMVALGPRHFWLVSLQGELFAWNDGETTRLDTRYGWAPSRVTELYQDPGGGLWVGTYGKGLAYVNPRPVMENYALADGLPDLYVQTVRVDTFRQWALAGTVRGLAVVDAQGGHTIASPAMDAPPLIRDLVAMPDGIWVGAPGSYRFFETQHQQVPIRFVNGTSLLPMPNNRLIKGLFGPHMVSLWTARSSGDWVDSAFYFVNTPQARSNMFLPDTTGMPPSFLRLWLATNGGLYSTPLQWAQVTSGSREKPKLQEQFFFRNLSPRGSFIFDPHPALLGLQCYEVLRDVQGKLWAATGSGLFECDADSCREFALGPALGSSHVSALCQDAGGRLWVATYGGLYAVEADRQQVLYFSMEDGLPANTLHDIDYAPATHSLWLGSSNGLTQLWVDPLINARYTAQAGPTYLTKVQLDGKGLDLARPLPRLPYHNQAFSLDFTSPLFRQTHRLQYRYRLNTEGAEPAPWQETRQPSVNFSRLPPGAYHFEAQASLNGTLWGSSDEVWFTVATPWWQQLWFYGLAVVMGTAMVMGFIRWRAVVIRRQENTKRERERQIAQLRHQAMSAMLSPHFVFNALQSIQHFIRQRNEEEANDYLLKFARLIRLNMESSAQDMIPLPEELDRMQLYVDLERLRLPIKLDYRITPAPDLVMEQLLIPGMLMQPYIENALWHGFAGLKRDGQITIYLRQEQGMRLFVSIEDNGVGLLARKQMQQRRTHKSRGTEITRERLAYLEHLTGVATKVSIEDRQATGDPGTGTRVQLVLPLLQAAQP